MKIKKLNESFDAHTGRWVINFGHWYSGNGMSFSNANDLIKFLDNHYVVRGTMITYMDNTTDEFRSHFNYGENDAINDEMIKQGYTSKVGIQESLKDSDSKTFYFGYEGGVGSYYNNSSFTIELNDDNTYSWYCTGDDFSPSQESFSTYDMALEDAMNALQPDDDSELKIAKSPRDLDYLNESVLKEENYFGAYCVLNPDGTYAGVPCETIDEARELANQKEGRTIYKLSKVLFGEGLKEEIGGEDLKDEDDVFALYFPYLPTKLVNKERAIKQLEFELDRFKNGSGADIAGKGFGIYCVQSFDKNDKQPWYGRYSSKEFLGTLHEDVNEDFAMANAGGADGDEIRAMRAEQKELEARRVARKTRMALYHNLFDKYEEEDPNAKWINKVFDLFFEATEVKLLNKVSEVPNEVDGQKVKYYFSVKDYNFYVDAYKDYIYIVPDSGLITEEMENKIEIHRGDYVVLDANMYKDGAEALTWAKVVSKALSPNGSFIAYALDKNLTNFNIAQVRAVYKNAEEAIKHVEDSIW